MSGSQSQRHTPYISPKPEPLDPFLFSLVSDAAMTAFPSFRLNLWVYIRSPTLGRGSLGNRGDRGVGRGGEFRSGPFQGCFWLISIRDPLEIEDSVSVHQSLTTRTVTYHNHGRNCSRYRTFQREYSVTRCLTHFCLDRGNTSPTSIPSSRPTSRD
jgi:hypothetical protein